MARRGGRVIQGRKPMPNDVDALAFVMAVKETFPDEQGRYEDFLTVLRDFRAGRLNTNNVIERVKELFRGHRNLLMGFNIFLPKEREITLPCNRRPVGIAEAMSFIHKVKMRFEGVGSQYILFTTMLESYKNGYKTVAQVYEETSILFAGQEDLMEEFTDFLPRAPSGDYDEIPEVYDPPQVSSSSDDN